VKSGDFSSSTSSRDLDRLVAESGPKLSSWMICSAKHPAMLENNGQLPKNGKSD
jgi:hypothetical protein